MGETSAATTEPAKPQGYPGDCAAWDDTRRFWCTLPRGHDGEHVSINQGQVMKRW